MCCVCVWLASLIQMCFPHITNCRGIFICLMGAVLSQDSAALLSTWDYACRFLNSRRFNTIKHRLHDFFFSHKHITSFPSPSSRCICVWPRQWLGSLLRETKQSHLVSQALRCPHTKQQTRGNHPVLVPVPALLPSNPCPRLVPVRRTYWP